MDIGTIETLAAIKTLINARKASEAHIRMIDTQIAEESAKVPDAEAEMLSEMLANAGQ